MSLTVKMGMVVDDGRWQGEGKVNDSGNGDGWLRQWCFKTSMPLFINGQCGDSFGDWNGSGEGQQ